MVNVDFASPSLLLGTALIGCGVLLLNLRNFQNKVSRDADIVVAAMVSIVGSTLIFQGWRLDPLLLLCQALTTSVAFWYGLETFRLRSREADMVPPPPPQLPPGVPPDFATMDPAQQAAAMQQFYQQQQPGAGFSSQPGMPYLPPGAESYYPWGTSGADSATGAPSTSGRGSPEQGLYGMNSYAETVQYDYYGNPIMPQEPAAYGATGYGSSQYGSSTSSPYGEPSGEPYGQPQADSAAGGYTGGYSVGYASPSQGMPSGAGTTGYDTRAAPAAAGPASYAAGGYDTLYGARSSAGIPGPSSSSPPLPPLQAGPFSLPPSSPGMTSPGVQTSYGAGDASYPQSYPAGDMSGYGPSPSYNGGGGAGAVQREAAAWDGAGAPGGGMSPAVGAPGPSTVTSYPAGAAGAGAGAAAGVGGSPAAAGPAAASGASPGQAATAGRVDYLGQVDDWE